MLRAGLTRIIVSIDAVRPETYRALRLRGNLDKVEQNLRMLARIKQMVGSNCFIQAQFISTPENEKEAAEFERRWASVEGIDQVVIRRERSHAGQVKRHDQYEVREEERLPCRYLWESVVVLQDGTVVPCCKDFDGKAPLGNIGTESMESIWNGDAIKRLRKAHAVGEWSSIDLCGNCSEWRGLAEFPPEEAEGLAEAVRAEKSQFRTDQVHLRVWE